METKTISSHQISIFFGAFSRPGYPLRRDTVSAQQVSVSRSRSSLVWLGKWNQVYLLYYTLSEAIRLKTERLPTAVQHWASSPGDWLPGWPPKGNSARKLPSQLGMKWMTWKASAESLRDLYLFANTVSSFQPGLYNKPGRWGRADKKSGYAGNLWLQNRRKIDCMEE